VYFQVNTSWIPAVSGAWLRCNALLALDAPHQAQAAAVVVAIGRLQHPDFSTSPSAKTSQVKVLFRLELSQSLVYDTAY
jgi:hypothetical protein